MRRVHKIACVPGDGIGPQIVPEDGLETLRAFDAVYFGAVGLPGVVERPPCLPLVSR